MGKENILLIIISIIALAYSIINLIRGRQIQVECQGSSKLVIYVVYTILALLILFKSVNVITIVTAATIVLSGIIYALVPSGYNDKGIYLRGRFFDYKKISQMDFDFVNNYYQLSFFYHGRCHLLIAKREDKEKLKGAYSLYSIINNK